MLDVLPVKGFRIGEDRLRLLERNIMLPKVLDRFSRIPGEHIYVYTLMSNRLQTAGAFKFRSPPAPRLNWFVPGSASDTASIGAATVADLEWNVRAGGCKVLRVLGHPSGGEELSWDGALLASAKNNWSAPP